MPNTVLIAENVVEIMRSGNFNLDFFLEKHIDSGREKSLFPVSGEFPALPEGADLYIGNVRYSDLVVIYFTHKIADTFEKWVKCEIPQRRMHAFEECKQDKVRKRVVLDQATLRNLL